MMKQQKNRETPIAQRPKYLNLINKRLLTLALFCCLFLLFTYILSSLDKRTATNHKPFHSSVTIATFYNNGSFLALPYSYIQHHALAKTTFLATEHSGKKEKNIGETFSYHVLKQNNEQQLIETKLRTHNQITIATYSATATSVTLLTSRVYTLNFVILATLFALIVILILKFIHKFINRRTSSTNR